MSPASSRAELLDVVDDDDRVIGQAARGDVYARRLRHRTVFILVRDERERIFVHQRAADKLVFPSHYDMFVGGVVGAGETYDTAAWREASEELGVELPAPAYQFRFRHDGADYRTWSAVYELRFAGEVDPPADEITWHGFLSESQLRARLAEWPWPPDSLAAYQQRPSTGRGDAARS